MKNGITKNLLTVLVLLCSVQFAFAQTAMDGSSLISYVLLAVVAFVLLGFVLSVADNMLAIEAKQTGADKTGKNLGLFPSMREIFRPKIAPYADRENVQVFNQGFDIMLEGVAEEEVIANPTVNTFAVRPPDFIGISPIPKVTVEVGDNVNAGDVLFFDKKNERIKYCAPVSGEIMAINRGEKRSISEVVILADKAVQHKTFGPFDFANGDRSELVDYLLESGVWPMIRQRPFNTVADPNDVPRDIYISTFDSAPLAPNLNLVVDGRETAFQRGLDVLKRLTSGTVHLGLSAYKDQQPHTAFTEATGVEKHWFYGPHPAGNVGVQIHNTNPLGPNDKIWTMGVQEVCTLGALFTEGRFNAERVVALTGDELNSRHYVRTYLGASIGDLINDKLDRPEDELRVISGDVLSGAKTSTKSYLGFHDDQITVIEEGDYYEPFGWLLPISPRPSVSGSLPNKLIPNFRYDANTNTHGEKRAFVVTGTYERMLPMDILVQPLMKAILVNDFERMEGLGAYELVEEDVALAEFACTSKQPLQQILRNGLEIMREQS